MTSLFLSVHFALMNNCILKHCIIHLYILCLPHRVCYERVSWNPTLASFALSSWWHGFYPGYYMGLLSFGVSLMAAKKVGCRGLSSMGCWTTDANLYYGV